MAGERYRGRCLCGGTTFTATIPKLEVDACHCSMCRRVGGGPVIAVMADDIVFEDDSLVTSYRSSEWAERLFCSRCGTNLMWRTRDKSMTSVPTGVFDPPLDEPLHMEIFIDDKPCGYAFAGERKRLTGAQVMAMFTGEA